MSNESDPPSLDADLPRLDADASTPASLQRAIRAASAHTPSDEALRALGAALGPMLGPPGTPGAPGSPANVPSGASAPSATGVGTSAPALTKVAIGVLALGAAVAIGIAVPRSKTPDLVPSDLASHTAPSAQATVADPASSAPGAGPDAAASDAPSSEAAASAEPTTAPSSSVAVEPSPSSANSPAPASTETPSEVSLLARARKALDRDPATALALTAEHRRLYPKGQLSQEREVISIEALRKLGRSNEADVGTDRFHTQYPSSIHQQSVDTPPH